MTSPTDLIAHGASGLHPADDLDGAREAARSRGWRVVELDTSAVSDKPAFMTVCRQAFSLPDWFGDNWDALADSLTEVGEPPGALVLWQGAGHLDPQVRETAVEVFAGRAALADSGFGPFLVLVGGLRRGGSSMKSL